MNARIKTTTVLKVTAILILGYRALAFADDSVSSRFMSALTRPMTISTFNINPDHYAHLSQEQLKNVLSAKEAIGAFFRTLESPGSNVNQFLAADFSNRNISSMALRKTIVAEETSVIQLGISDFKLRPDGRTIDLEFYAVTISEGTFNIGNGRASLIRSKGEWKISAIDVKH